MNGFMVVISYHLNMGRYYQPLWSMTLYTNYQTNC